MKRPPRYPLYRQVSDDLRLLLKSMRQGERLPTERELVQRFDVSLVTVRQAMKLLESEGFIERRQGSGTYVADALRQNQHVGVLLDVDISSDNLSPFYAKLVIELQNALTEHDVPNRVYLGRLPLGTHPSAEITCQSLIDDVNLGRINGIIAYFVSKNPFWGSRFQKAGIPTLDSDYLHHPGLCNFLSLSLQYFLAHKRRHIAFIGWESPFDGRHPLKHAWQEVCEKMGAKIEPSLIDLTANGWERGMGWERFLDIWRASPEKPDALIIFDDMLYSDCIKAIETLHIDVPRDLSIAVKTSDALELEHKFPVFESKLHVAAYAASFARAMKSLLHGGPALAPRRPITSTQIITPATPCTPMEEKDFSPLILP